MPKRVEFITKNCGRETDLDFQERINEFCASHDVVSIAPVEAIGCLKVLIVYEVA